MPTIVFSAEERDRFGVSDLMEVEYFVCRSLEIFEGRSELRLQAAAGARGKRLLPREPCPVASLSLIVAVPGSIAPESLDWLGLDVVIDAGIKVGRRLSAPAGDGLAEVADPEAAASDAVSTKAARCDCQLERKL